MTPPSLHGDPPDTNGQSLNHNSQSLLQNAVFYLAAANLYMLPFWLLAFARNGMPTDRKFVEQFYELSQIFDHVDYFAALLLSVIIAVVLFVLGRVLSTVTPRLHGWYDLVLGLSGLAVLAMVIWLVLFRPSGHIRLSDEWFFEILGVGGAAVLALVLVTIFVRGYLELVARYLVLSTVPVILVLAVNSVVAGFRIAAPDASLFVSDRSLAPRLQGGGKNKPRVVVIFFDMWDYRVTFETRPNWLKLPEIDRFADQAFFSKQAVRASLSTRMAFPAMITGHKVMWSYPVKGDDLALIFAEDYSPSSWRKNPGLLKTAREAGYNTSIVATAYHPYCRLFNKFISDCWIDDTLFSFSERTVFNRMDDVVTEVLRFVPFVKSSLFEPRHRYHDHWGIHLHLAFEDKIASVAADPKFDFVFAHLLLPHPPFIRDYKTSEWRYFDEQASRDNYFGNLQALDILLGKMRKRMENAGLWDDTAILLSADHGYSLVDWPKHVPNIDVRVPFLLKLPGQTRKVESNKRFLMTSIRPVLESLFRGELTTPEQVEQYLSYREYEH